MDTTSTPLDTIVTIMIPAESPGIDLPLYISIGIAVLALAVSVVITVASILHNRKSVEPQLTHDYTCRAIGPIAGIKIRNNGLGPAILGKIELYFDEKVYSGNSEDESRRLAKDAAFISKDVEIWAYEVGDAMGVDLDRWLIAIPCSSKNRLTPEDKDRIKAIGFLIEYESFYGKKKTLEAGPKKLKFYPVAKTD